MPLLPRSLRRKRVDFDELVADAMLVARAGVRQRIKNLLIVHTLRDGADFDLGWYLTAVRDELDALARETEADAERLQRQLDYARGRKIRAVTPSDYVHRDLPTLRLRRRVMQALAAELRALAADQGTAETLIDEARAQALDEIAGTAAAVPRRRSPRTLTGPARRIALGDLHDDIADLAQDAGG